MCVMPFRGVCLSICRWPLLLLQVVPLTEVVNADEVLRSGVLRDPAVQEQLIPLLAEGQQVGRDR